ncbi:MAG: YicC/YloC family endoribonuclease [Phycisphaerales bacterium]
MTGFGEASAEVGGAHYFVEVRSLNSKYFKAVIRLPEEFQLLEAEIETQLRHRLQRGSVFMTANYSDITGEFAYHVNDKALTHYLAQIEKVPQVASGKIRIDMGAMLSLPGVLQPPADEEQRIAHARATMHDLVEKACDRVVQMREREGQFVLTDLRTHAAIITQRLARIVERAPSVSGEFEKRLKGRIEQMLKDLGLAVQPVDIVREIAIAAERADIAEEIARLTGHMQQFEQMLTSTDPKPIGRTLDFLTQEMLREANTIASKCGDAEISKWTVEIKGAIDRIKEQVQNVE